MHFRMGEREDACALVIRYHYSRRPPANIQAVGTWHTDGGLWGDRGDVVAACFFSIPPTRWAESVWELSRLVRHPDCSIPLTGLIASTVRFASKKQECPGIFVSFADATQGHHGGIYQAASWNYDGKRDSRMDGLTVNGSFIPGRSCNSKWGTQSPTRLKEQHKDWEIIPHFDLGKHLYWRATNRIGRRVATSLGLSCFPYPKPAVGVFV